MQKMHFSEKCKNALKKNLRGHVREAANSFGALVAESSKMDLIFTILYYSTEQCKEWGYPYLLLRIYIGMLVLARIMSMLDAWWAPGGHQVVARV